MNDEIETKIDPKALLKEKKYINPEPIPDSEKYYNPEPIPIEDKYFTPTEALPEGFEINEFGEIVREKGRTR